MTDSRKKRANSALSPTPFAHASLLGRSSGRCATAMDVRGRGGRWRVCGWQRWKSGGVAAVVAPSESQTCIRSVLWRLPALSEGSASRQGCARRRGRWATARARHGKSTLTFPSACVRPGGAGRAPQSTRGARAGFSAGAFTVELAENPRARDTSPSRRGGTCCRSPAGSGSASRALSLVYQPSGGALLRQTVGAQSQCGPSYPHLYPPHRPTLRALGGGLL